MNETIILDETTIMIIQALANVERFGIWLFNFLIIAGILAAISFIVLTIITFLARPKGVTKLQFMGELIHDITNLVAIVTDIAVAILILIIASMYYLYNK